MSNFGAQGQKPARFQLHLIARGAIMAI